MNEEKKLESQQTNIEDTNVNSIDGDQNVISGRVENGGIAIQGGEHEIKIVQTFNTYAAPEQKKSPDREEIIKIRRLEPETILIPEGPFWMGEAPEFGITLPDYRIGKYPVTNAQYEAFVIATKRSVAPEMEWHGQGVPKGLEKLPVVGVTWFDAREYCEWLSAETKRAYSLPNEAQWEKACRGNDKRIYPWGDVFDLERCNHGRAQLASVEAYRAQNENGCFDFVGNVRQWTCTLWGEKLVPPDYAYPWTDDDSRNDINNTSRSIRRVVRGGSFKENNLKFMRCSARSGQVPDDTGARYGFRVVMSV